MSEIFRPKARREFRFRGRPRCPSFLVRPGTSDVTVIRDIWDRNVYRRRGLRIFPGERWLDLGAHIGAFAVLAGYCGAQVVAYEANIENAQLAWQNTARNNIPAPVVPKAVIRDTASDSTVNLFRRPDPRRGSLVCPEKLIVRFSRVDAVRFAEISDGFDCVKLSLEGEEIPILETADLSGFRKVFVDWNFHANPSLSVLRRVLTRLMGAGLAIAIPPELKWATTGEGKTTRTWSGPPRVRILAARRTKGRPAKPKRARREIANDPG